MPLGPRQAPGGVANPRPQGTAARSVPPCAGPDRAHGGGASEDLKSPNKVPNARNQNPFHTSPARGVSAGIKTAFTSTLAEQLCTEPSPIRKFTLVGWPAENTALPGGGAGG